MNDAQAVPENPSVPERPRRRRIGRWIAAWLVVMVVAVTFWIVEKPGDGWSKLSEAKFVDRCEANLGSGQPGAEAFCVCMLDELKKRGVQGDEAPDRDDLRRVAFWAGFECGIGFDV